MAGQKLGAPRLRRRTHNNNKMYKDQIIIKDCLNIDAAFINGLDHAL